DAESPDDERRRARRARDGDGGAVRRWGGAAAAALVGISRDTGADRVLERHAESPARAPRLHARRKRLDGEAALPVGATRRDDFARGIAPSLASVILSS